MDQRNHNNLNDQNRINSQSGARQTTRNSASGIRRGALEGLRRDLALSAKQNFDSIGRRESEKDLKRFPDRSRVSDSAEIYREGSAAQNDVKLSDKIAASHTDGGRLNSNVNSPRVISEDETLGEENSVTDFIEDLSIDELSFGNKKKKKKKIFTGQVLRRMLIFVFMAIFIVSSGRLGYIIYDHYKAEQAYDDIDTEIQEMSFRRLLPESSGITMLTLEAAQFTDILDENSSTSEYYEYLQKMKAKINYLQEKNPDIIGYINVPNTKIDYPILHCENNEYYLNHDFLGNYRLAGAIFMDFRNESDFSSNYNTCIYGHNLSNGNMMNNITLFRDEVFFNENEYIEITSPDGLYIYQVFAIYKTDMYNNYIDTYFQTPEDFVEFAYEMKSRSMYQREGVEFTSSDRLLTLSTCTNIIQEERYALQAKLIRIER